MRWHHVATQHPRRRLLKMNWNHSTQLNFETFCNSLSRLRNCESFVCKLQKRFWLGRVTMHNNIFLRLALFPQTKSPTQWPQKDLIFHSSSESAHTMCGIDANQNRSSCRTICGCILFANLPTKMVGQPNHL